MFFSSPIPIAFARLNGRYAARHCTVTTTALIHIAFIYFCISFPSEYWHRMDYWQLVMPFYSISTKRHDILWLVITRSSSYIQSWLLESCNSILINVNDMLLLDVMWYGTPWYDVMWLKALWHCMIWHNIWCDEMCCNEIWCGVMWWYSSQCKWTYCMDPWKTQWHNMSCHVMLRHDALLHFFLALHRLALLSDQGHLSAFKHLLIFFLLHYSFFDCNRSFLEATRLSQVFRTPMDKLDVYDVAVITWAAVY